MKAGTFSRRRFLGGAAGVAGITAVAGSGAAGAANRQGNAAASVVLTEADGDWAPLRLVRPELMEWQAGAKWDLKMLFHDQETGAHLIMLTVPPGWEGGLNHYHEWHEWAYILSGDLTNDEFVSPDQHRGARKQFREGDFLSRPPFSLHGIEEGGLRSQIGCTLLIQEEGPSELTHGVVPKHENFSDRYKSVNAWSNPRLLDTIGDMLWDDMKDMPGVKVKYLMDNANFRARLHWIEAGFKGTDVPSLATPAWLPSGRQFRYLLFGDLTTNAFARPGASAQTVTATKDHLIDLGPRCISALPEGVATQKGCVWLQIEYGDARGVVSDKAIAAPRPA